MSLHWSLLCPVDYSEASLGALHYAAAICERTGAALSILTVDDPQIVEFAPAGTPPDSAAELRRFAATVLKPRMIDASFEVRKGGAAVEIHAAAVEGRHTLIVMGTHGRRGAAKWMLGTVAERVLRDTPIPVLLVPHDPGPQRFVDLAALVSPVLAPVDFSAGSGVQLEIAARAAIDLGAEMIVGHVVAPLTAALPAGINEADITNERRDRSWQRLRTMVSGLESTPPVHMAVSDGEPENEIAHWVRQHRVGLLVMALHGDPTGSPRMGSVTYRVITRTKVLTLALPPSLSRGWPFSGDS